MGNKLPDGWLVSRNESAKGGYSFTKSFPDGTYVEITISKASNYYQIRTLAESRTSGPTEAIQTEVTSLDAALNLVYQECGDWDNDLD